MEEFLARWVDEAPATAICFYLMWCWQTWGKETLSLLREVKSMLEQAREERRLSEAAQAHSAVPLTRKSR